MANTFLNVNASNVGGGTGSGFHNPALTDLDMAGFDILNVGELTSPANATFSLLSAENNGASAVGFELDTSNALSTAGAKIISIRNNNVEKLAISKDGDILQSGGNAIWTVLPSEGGVGIQAALDAAEAAGGGIVQLMEGTYDVSTELQWPTANLGSDVWLRGVGPSTILDVNLTNWEYGIRVRAILSVEGEGISNTSFGGTSITLTTVAKAGNFLENDIIAITGTNSSMKRIEIAEVAADGNPGTGVVTLKAPLRYALTTATVTLYNKGKNNRISDMKFIHSSGDSHAFLMENQYNCLAENIVCDGVGGFGSGYSIQVQRCVYPTLRRIDVKDYLDIETFGGGSASHGVILFNDYGLIMDEVNILNCSNNAAVDKSMLKISPGAFENCIIKNCKFINSDTVGIELHSSASLTNLVFESCTAENSRSYLLLCEAAVDSLMISNCNFNRGRNVGLRFNPVSGGKVSLNNCNMRAMAQEAVSLNNTTEIAITGGLYDGNPGALIIQLCDTVSISGVSARSNTSLGAVYLNDNDNVAITGNSFVANDYGIRSNGNNSDVVISGNVMRSSVTNGIKLQTTDTNFVIVGNDTRGETNDFSTSLTHTCDSYRTFTPTVTLVGGAGNTVPVYTTNDARFWRVGNEVNVEVYLTGDGGAEGAGSGVINILLPVAASASHSTSKFFAGYGLNNATEYPLMGQIAGSATTISLSYFNAINTTAAFTGDDQNNATRTIRLKFSYEA